MEEQISLDELNRRLAEVQDWLLELAPEDLAARHELRMKQDRLRKLARQYASEGDLDRSSADLLAELRARESALEEIRHKMMNAATQAGGGGVGAGSFEGPLDAFKIDNALMAGTGAEDLMQRIARLETILQERGAL